ncbi:hypothetical protein GALL_409710 [mine drainage metagenome]|uniref:Uncharacterized protein n=1 Tax=mine drainage metagenome TaxID=410659 RepID=A0A1J5Q228_9ZZZZ
MVELGKQAGGQFAEDIDQNIQAAPMRHADHNFLHAPGASLLDQFIHGSDEAFTTFKRKTLLSDVLGV